MTKKQIKKEAYKKIVKEGLSHQEVYDNLKTSKASFNVMIAAELKKIPSLKVMQEKQNLKIIFLVVVGILLATRILALYGLQQMGLSPAVLLIALALWIVAPGIMIYGLLARKTELIRSGALALTFGLLRNFMNEGIVLDPVVLIFYAPWIASIVMGFGMGNWLKTPYNKKIYHEMIDGKKTTQVAISFDEAASEMGDSDVLDL
ncbi:MAG: hypothetical protein MI810_16185 [Flavobacteriales bacterium]|nr:hypothetical protein [Flavobacteriales bacterium]